MDTILATATTTPWYRPMTGAFHVAQVVVLVHVDGEVTQVSAPAYLTDTCATRLTSAERTLVEAALLDHARMSLRLTLERLAAGGATLAPMTEGDV